MCSSDFSTVIKMPEKILKEKEILLADRNFNPLSFYSIPGRFSERQNITLEKAE